MSSHQPPAHLRYLKARLRPLLRPQVWGTIIFLIVVSTFAGIYFANLEEFIADENQDAPTLNKESNNKEAEDNQTSESRISPEDRAIAADIDISTVLESDLAANTETIDAAPEKPRENIFEQYMRQKQEKNQAANSSQAQTNQQPAANTDDNPFTIKFPTVNNAGRNNAASSTNPFVYNLPNSNSTGLNLPDTATAFNNKNALQTALDRANGYNNQGNLDANGKEINPLQAALDRQVNSTNNSSNSTSTTNQLGQSNINLIAQPNQITPLLGTTPYNNSGVTTTTTNNGLPIQGSVPLTPYSNVPGNTTLPTQVPTTGIPSNLPNTYNPGLTNNVPNSYTYLNQPQVPTTTTTLPSTSGVNNSNIPNSVVPTTPNQVQNTPAPFSIPNNPPGRTIGGGQINTFSNP